MSFTNDRFQIFVNKTPLNNSSASSTITPAQNNSFIKRFTFSAGGIQANPIENNVTLSSENLHGSTNTPDNQLQTFVSNSLSNYQGNAYIKENYGAYDDEQDSTPAYPEDSEERDYSSGLSNSSKKIRKEVLGTPLRTWGNKKAMQEDYKLKTKRNPWQPEEDDQVLDLVAKYGQSWALIASLMKDRSGKQIRDRYLNKLRPDINKGEWTEREDEILIALCTKIGHKWSRIATQLPGRTEGQVKNRFYSHIKKRMPKWYAGLDVQEQTEEEEQLFQEDVDLARVAVKEEVMSFGMQERAKANRVLFNLNNTQGVNTNTSFGSLNIKLNTIGQGGFPVEMNSEKKFGMHAKHFGGRNDPTDVISYNGLAALTATKNTSNMEDDKTSYQLSSTRASSLSQGKEFEESFEKMAKLWTGSPQGNVNKGKMISFSLLNGNLVPTQNTPVQQQQQVNKLDFSNGQGKISLKIF